MRDDVKEADSPLCAPLIIVVKVIAEHLGCGRFDCREKLHLHFVVSYVQIIIIEHFTVIELLSHPKKSYIFIAEYRREMMWQQKVKKWHVHSEALL